MPDYMDFVNFLAKRVGFSKQTIDERYRELGKLVADWRTGLPWVDANGKNVGGKAGREANAKYLKDVITFQNQLKEKVRQIDVDEGELDDGDESETDDESFGPISWPSFDDSTEVDLYHRPTKRRKLGFTPSGSKSCQSTEPVNPLQSEERKYLPSAGRPTSYVRPTKRPGADRQEALHQEATSLLSLIPSLDPTSSFVSLHSREPSLETTELRTAILRYPETMNELANLGRLSKLALTQGGEGNIKDEELFGDGEFEGLFRSEKEMETLQAMWELQGRMQKE